MPPTYIDRATDVEGVLQGLIVVGETLTARSVHWYFEGLWCPSMVET